MDDATDLRSAGLRVTAARLAILSTVRSGNHLDAENIARGVREKVGHVSTQGVYDALHVLTRAGLLRRIEPADSPARYEVRVGDDHHHLVCRACGGVRDVDCTVGRASCLRPSDAHGFVIDEAEVVFWGMCSTCREEGRKASGPMGASGGGRRTAAD